MRRPLLSALVLICSLPAVASDIVATRGGVELRTEVVERHLRQVPADVRPLLVETPERLETLIDSMLLEQQLYAESQRRGLAEREDIRKLIDATVREVLVRAVVDDTIAQLRVPDFQALARERYLTDPELGVVKAGKRVRHLLVSASAVDEGIARERASELLVRVKEGEDFADLVKRYSDDPSKEENDGVFLVQADSLLDPAFLTASLALEKVGDTTEPVKSQFGYHLIQLIEDVPAGRQPLAAVQNEIADQLRADWIKAERRKAIDAFREQPLEYNGDGISRLRQEFGKQ